MLPSPSLCAPDSAAIRLRVVLHALLAALGGLGVQGLIALVLYRRIGRIAGRIERMLVRFRAGKLRQITQHVPRLGHASRRATCVMPRRFGWLVRVGGHQAAGFGAQLQAVLEMQDMTELLAASPQARRLLSPLCRALAISLPGASAQAEPGEMRRRRRRRVLLEPMQIPLPRGVLSAARRDGFGKDR